MHLTTDRLLLDSFTTEGRDRFMAIYMNGQVMKYVTGRALAPEEAEEKFRKVLECNARNNGTGYYSVFIKQGNKYIGLVKLVHPDLRDPACLELGFCLFPEFWGKGFASEITSEMVGYAATIASVNRLIAIIDPANEASAKVLIKSGFVLTATGDYGGLPSGTYTITLH